MGQWNYRSSGGVVSVTTSADVEVGEGVLVGSLFGVALRNAASGAPVDIGTGGEWELPKTSAQAWTQGATIYWDDTAKVCTTTSTSNTKIGCATAAAANPSSTGLVRLNGTV